MFKRVLIGALIVTGLATGGVLCGQNTGGDKVNTAAPGLNPQPLPPGRHHHQRRHRRHGRHPNAITVKQK